MATRQVYKLRGAKWQHLPEDLLLVTLQPNSHESIVIVTSTLFTSLLICDALG